jgi:hypothetical protein
LPSIQRCKVIRWNRPPLAFENASAFARPPIASSMRHLRKSSAGMWGMSLTAQL